MRALRFLRLLAVLAVSAVMPALAQNGGQDELWEITMSVQSDGMSMPAMKQNTCVPRGKREERVPMEKNCRMIESRQSGNRYIFKFECVDGADRTVGNGEMEDLGKDAYRGFMNSSSTREGETVSMRMDLSGKRLGHCTWEDPAKQVAALEAGAKARMAAVCDDSVAKLDAVMVFGGPGVPPESIPCRDRQGAFCSRAADELKSVRDRVTWEAVQGRYGWEKFESACLTCKLNLTATTGPLCRDAVAQGDWLFVKQYCAEASALREKHCAGRDPSSVDKDHADMCQVLGGMKRKADAKADAPPAVQPVDKPAEPARKPSLTDKLKEGADTLKKFLKF
jgi:hypothetical protein